MKDSNDDMDFITNPHLIYVLVLLTIASLVAAVLAMLGGAFPEAGRIGGVSTALATLLLVSVTLRYVSLTNDLVQITQETHDQEIQQRKAEKQENLDSLRRALIEEISTIGYFEEFAEVYGLKASLYEFISPTTIYEANADQIGRLSEEEAEVIVEFYTRVEQLEALLKMQRELDTPFEKDAPLRYFKYVLIMQEELMRKLTGGKITPDDRDLRTKEISDRYQKLARAREEAIEQLENQLGPS